MKRFLLTFFFISAISGGIFYAVCVPHGLVGYAREGVLDLRGANLEEDVYMLFGEWEFYWDRLYEPGDFSGPPPDGRAFIPVPAAWNSASYPITGYATYRLAILAPDDAKLMMYVPEILSSAKVWANGEVIFSAGTVGTGRESSVPYAKNEIVDLPVKNGAVEIIVQASNYNDINGGIQHLFRVGPASALPRAAFSRWILLAGLAGAFFIIGLYHLALFLYRRIEGGSLVYLVFAASCILGGSRFFLDFDSIAQYFLRTSLNIHFNFIYTFLTYLHGVVVFFFALLAFEVKLGPRAKIAFTAMLCLPLVLLLILPAPMSIFTAFLILVPIFAISVLAAKGLSLERVRGRPYLGLYFISLVFFTLWGAIANSIAQAYFFAPLVLSNTFMMLSQFVMLSQDYAESRRKALELAAKNDFYHRMAHDLLTPLTVVSTSVQVADMIPAKAPALLKKSQEEIMKMAGMINAALDESEREKNGSGN
ncbi:MAG: hypothetical protein FWG09_02335 [Synergistaceae bacterium]|nr:hypothetical protein [Synergistaceae bacterium]